MNGLSNFEFYLIIATLGISAILIGRLIVSGLSRRYPFFTALITASFAEEVIGLSLPYGSVAYLWGFIICEAVISFLFALTVLELFAIVLRDLKGLADIARRFVRWAVVLSVAISSCLLIFEQKAQGLINGFLIFERAVMCSLLLFVALIVAFLIHYPVPLNRNVIMYSIGYTVFFLSQTAALFIHDLDLGWDRLLSHTGMVITCSCLIFWTFALSRKGEQKKVASGIPRDPADAERLLAQLQAINNSLLRASKK